MRRLIGALSSHLYGAVGLSILVLMTAWLLVDFAELSRHFGRAGWDTVIPLYTMRMPVLLHRLMPLALLIGTALTIGVWASDRHLQNAAALGLKPSHLPLLAVAILSPVVAIWGYAGTEQIPPLHREENRLLYDSYGIGGQHYGSFHKPTGLVVEKDWLVRFKPAGPTVIKNLEAVRLKDGKVLERVSAKEASLRVNGWIANDVMLSQRKGNEVESQNFDTTPLPFFRTSSSLDYAIGFPDEFQSAYLLTMAERAATAGSDPRPFIFERERRIARVMLLLLMLAATALICARIGPGGSFNVIMARATMMAAAYEVATFIGASLALVLPRGKEFAAAWIPVALVVAIALRGLQRLGRLR
jgi:lipopolysaccharide export LptBFGC system permease protein LptF